MKNILIQARRHLAALGLLFAAGLAQAAPTVSITSPANNAVFSPPATVTVNATATPSAGTTIKQVAFYQGTTLIGTATSAPYSVTWSNAPAGTYSLTAKATDNKNKTTTSSAVSIVVDVPPTVSLTSPSANQAFTAPATVTLTASAADSDGTVSKVDFYQGATLIGTATAAPYTVTWSNAPAGSYSLTAKATDNKGITTTSAAVPITVNGNTPPTVSLTSPAANTVFNAPAAVTLTASAADSDGTVAKVDFYQGTTLIGTATAAPYAVTWSNAPAGSYSLTAKATDNQGAVTTSTAIPIIINALPTVTLTSPAANTVFNAPAAVTLTASAADSDGSVSKVDFYQGTTLIGTATAAPYAVTWSNAPAGSYSLTAKATDNRGAVTTSAAIPIVVDTPPTVSLTSPTANQTFGAPATITLTANAADSDGTVAKVDFYQGATLIGTATSAPYSITWSNAPAGSYSLTAKATDNLGAVTTSAAVAIVVDTPPTVSLTSPVANASFTAPATVTLTATAADSDGTVARVDFYQGATLIGTATSAPYAVTWNNAPAGNYSLTAKATDNQGIATTSVVIPITVIANTPPTVSLTSPAANQTFGAPATITLTANAADSDGTVAKVDFYQGTTLIGTATSAPYSITWSNAPAGSYSLTAKATDNQGAVTTSVAIAIAVDTPPTVLLTSPVANASFTAPATITLTATAADSDGTVSKVDFYQGTTLIGTATAAPYAVTWSNAPAGSYSLTAKATDDLGITTTSTVIPITVNANTPPTVSLTGPIDNSVFSAPATITLTANAADTDGTVSKVDFYQGTTLIGTATAAPYAVTWSNAPAGSYSLTAKATDNLGAITTSTAIAIIVDTPPTVSLTSPVANASFTAPATIMLTATAADSDGTVSKVDFYQGATLIGTATSAPYAVTWSNAQAGSYGLTAKATDNQGIATTSAAIPITVSVNAPPTVSLTSPAANTSFTAPATITLTAVAADSDGTVSQVGFYQGATLIGTATAAPYSIAWSNAPAGSYSFTAKATDNLGAVTTSAAVPITVTGGTSSVYYLYSDHLNTPRLVMDESNGVIWRSLPLAEPFGTTPPEEDPDGNGVPFSLNLRFPGQYFDKETNLNYNYYRDYDPSTGRYIQSDPIGLQGGINTYAYVGGRPLNYFDPTGENAAGALVIGGVVLGVGAAMSSSSSGSNSLGNAISGAINAVKEFCKPDDPCGPDTRAEAMAKALAFAGIPPSGGDCDPIPWGDYNNKGRNYAEMRQQGVPCMGYRSIGGRSKVEDHPDGHNDDNQPHHKCPHIHATNSRGEKAIFPYKVR